MWSVIGWVLVRFLGIVVLGVFWLTFRETVDTWRKEGWQIALATSWGKADFWEALGTVFNLFFMLAFGLTLLFYPF